MIFIKKPKEYCISSKVSIKQKVKATRAPKCIRSISISTNPPKAPFTSSTNPKVFDGVSGQEHCQSRALKKNEQATIPVNHKPMIES